jgi:hypothetical protein
MANQLSFDYDLRNDLFSAGIMAFLTYGTPEYFPTQCIRYYMLNELAKWRYQSSYQNHKSQKTIKRYFKRIEDWMYDRNFGYDGEPQQRARATLKEIYEFLVKRDNAIGKGKGKTSKHARTFKLVCEYGLPEKSHISANYMLPINYQAYWSACKALKKVLLEEYK